MRGATSRAVHGALLLLAACGAAHAADEVKPNLRAGNWRIAIAMDVPNASGPSTGPLEYDRCLTPNDTRNLLAVPAGSQCRVLDSNLQRDSLTWKIQCTQNGLVSVANGRIDFQDTRIDGRIQTVTESANMRINVRMAGRYLGACIPVKAPQPPAAAPRPSAPAKPLPDYRPD